MLDSITSQAWQNLLRVEQFQTTLQDVIPQVGAIAAWREPRRAVVVFGCSGIFFLTVSTLVRWLLYDFPADEFFWISDLVIWLPNLLIAFPTVMQLESKKWPRLLFVATAYLAASGSFFLYYMYLGWLVFDFLLKDHSRPNWYIVTKVMLLLAYDIVCTWFISDIIPQVY